MLILIFRIRIKDMHGYSIKVILEPFGITVSITIIHNLNEAWFSDYQVCSVRHERAHVTVVFHTTPRLWQVSKSQQVYRSIPWDSFNGDTWSSLWIREEIKDHPVNGQNSTTVAVTHIQWIQVSYIYKILIDDHQQECCTCVTFWEVFVHSQQKLSKQSSTLPVLQYLI